MSGSNEGQEIKVRRLDQPEPDQLRLERIIEAADVATISESIAVAFLGERSNTLKDCRGSTLAEAIEAAVRTFSKQVESA